MRSCALRAATAGLCLSITHGTAARQAQPSGGEFQVNIFTSGPQWGPAVALDSDGNFIVVWESQGSTGTDSSLTSVQARRYSFDGTPLGSEFQVNSFTTGIQAYASVAVDAEGDFVVVWHSDGSFGLDTDGKSILGQRYAANGTPLGTEVQINTDAAGDQVDPSVSMDADGAFVVVWADHGTGNVDAGHNIKGQRYSSGGVRLGAEFQVNSYTTGIQGFPSVSMDAAGNFVVVWASDGSSGTDTSSESIMGKLYLFDGTPAGAEFQVNTYTTNVQTWPSVSFDANGFVVVWSSGGSSGSDSFSWSVQARRFAPDGTPFGNDFQVNTYTTGYQRLSSVSQAADGSFVVVWENEPAGGIEPALMDVDTSETSIQGRGFAADGAPLGPEFQVNSYTTSFQLRPQVAVEVDGDFVVAWLSVGSSGTDSSDTSIQGQRYTVTIFADGFESGDSRAWSSTVP